MTRKSAKCLVEREIMCIFAPKTREMKKELGKWLMDISKYITTAVVLSSIFGGITETWKILTLGFLTITISIATGLILIHSSEKEEKNKK